MRTTFPLLRWLRVGLFWYGQELVCVWDLLALLLPLEHHNVWLHPWLCTFPLWFVSETDSCISPSCILSMLVNLRVKNGRESCSLMFWLSLSLRQTLCPEAQDEILPSFPVELHVHLPGKFSPVPLLQLLWVSTNILRLLSCRRERNDGLCSFSSVDGDPIPQPARATKREAVSVFFPIFPVNSWCSGGHKHPYMCGPQGPHTLNISHTRSLAIH